MSDARANLLLAMFRKPRVRDDAGRVHELFDPADGSGDRELAETCAIVVGSSEAVPGLTSRLEAPDVIVLLCAAFAPMAAMFLLPALGVSNLPSWGSMVVMAPTMLVVMAVWRHSARRRTAATLFATLVGHGRCPVCAYRIADLAPGEAGLAVCPECSSSWRCDRFDQAARAGSRQEHQGARHSEPGMGRWFGILGPGIKDASGAMRLLADLRSAGRSDPDLRRLAARLSRQTLAVRSVTALAWLVAGGFVLWRMFHASGGASVTNVMMLAAGFAFCLFGAAMARQQWMGRSRMLADVTAQAIREDGRCPACLARSPGASDISAPFECTGCRVVWGPLFTTHSVRRT